MLVAVVALLAAGTAYVLNRRQKERQQREIHGRLRQQHDFLRHLYDTVPCGIFQYGYDAPHAILNYNAACVRIYGGTELPVLGCTPAAVVKSGTGEEFLRKFEECERAGSAIVYDWPITRADGSEGYTECVLDIVETEQGKVFQEVFIDVTERKREERLVEKRYMQELARHGSDDEGLLYTACFDIDRQLLTETTIDVAGIRAGMSVEAFVETLLPELSEMQTPEELADFRTRFSGGRMAQCYADGRYEMSFDLCRRTGGQLQWLRSELTLRCHPATGHLMCFDYIYDVTDERVSGAIVRRMAFADCDGFLSLDSATGRCLQYRVGEGGALLRSEARYGETDDIHRLGEGMTEENRAALLRRIAPDQLRAQLESNEYYQVYATRTENGRRVDKAITYFYTDRAHGLLAATVSDVTEVKRSEVRQAQLLSDALAAAEKADAAKGQFLSRVSHEMRTPLNAILGFLELARDADAQETAKYLESSNLAARQLLAVINDVLDMSSIEAGKLKIASEPFNFKKLISSLTNIYGTQCRQKGLLFETRMKSVTEDWLVGDELRLNQILMNLLGNAVKFTSEGRIWLTVSQTSVDADKLFFRFEVSDTGVGMSAEMQARLFRPFEQESASTAKKYGGSGLGLSIVKNLVTMMGGGIRVESAPQQGAKFIVELPFTSGSAAVGRLAPASVQSLRVLAVDDAASERDYVDAVLRRMNVRHTCADGGAAALEELERAAREGDPYNVCLVDWRMPELSGEDTTRLIRTKYGRDVVLIVVSAYDFEQVVDKAKAAGANRFLSKPVFQSSLFDLFMELTDGMAAAPAETPQTWDFSGRRVLLAEDNTLNQIVARGYLQKFNVAVELAENGRVAVERFTASPPGYYDAILMDIQMPEMDGFEATRAIRGSRHPEAGTIAIIAQTADAFNEDIAKALSAGMNAHVSKPIEPDTLAKALDRAFRKKEDRA